MGRCPAILRAGNFLSTTVNGSDETEENRWQLLTKELIIAYSLTAPTIQDSVKQYYIQYKHLNNGDQNRLTTRSCSEQCGLENLMHFGRTNFYPNCQKDSVQLGDREQALQEVEQNIYMFIPEL
jgi:hypothetical protein